jgi:hypothetical protein
MGGYTGLGPILDDHGDPVALGCRFPQYNGPFDEESRPRWPPTQLLPLVAVLASQKTDSQAVMEINGHCAARHRLAAETDNRCQRVVAA